MNIQADNPRAPRPAETFVVAANKAVLDALPFADRRDFEDAERGFIGSRPDATVMAGLVPAIHVFPATTPLRRGCPAQGPA